MLYFKFLKLMMYLFLVLTIICGVFPIMFFIQAGKMNTAELGLKSLGLTTIGNLGACADINQSRSWLGEVQLTLASPCCVTYT